MLLTYLFIPCVCYAAEPITFIVPPVPPASAVTLDPAPLGIS
jgi:hypothetical protein